MGGTVSVFTVYGKAELEINGGDTRGVTLLRADGRLWPGAEWLVVWRDGKLQEASGILAFNNSESRVLGATGVMGAGISY